MKITPAAVTAHRNTQTMVHTEHLIRTEARNRTTNAIETIGLWTGSGPRSFTVDSVTRLFYGTSVIQMPVLHDQAGIEVRRVTLELVGVSDAVSQMIRTYDTYNAPLTIWRAEFDKNQNLLAAPERVFRGVIETAPIETAELGKAALWRWSASLMRGS